MNINFVLGNINCYIRHMQKVICKIFLYHISLVTAAYYEIVYTIQGVIFHYMPKNGFPTNLD